MIESCLNNFSIFCSFYLFQYHKQIIEVNLVGGVVPLLVSSGLVAYLRIKRRRILPVLKYSIFVGLVYSLAWAISDAFTHLISTPGFVFLVVAALFAGLWLYFNHSKLNKNTIGTAYLQVYAIGTFGIFLSDVTRTGFSFASIPYLGLDVTPVIMGGAGPSDAVFLAGIYYLLIFLFAVLLLSVVRRSYLTKEIS